LADELFALDFFAAVLLRDVVLFRAVVFFADDLRAPEVFFALDLRALLDVFFAAVLRRAIAPPEFVVALATANARVDGRENAVRPQRAR
jgi:hypothetical protein